MKTKEINPSNQSIYCYPGTSVFINNRNIMDKKELLQLEKMLVNYNLTELILGKGNFKRDLTYNHYLAIHRYLFESLYPFAGKLREEFTNKTNDEIEGEEGIRIYCNPDFIYDALNERLKLMKKQAVKVKSKDQLLDFLADNYMELYYIHPFREGNSRTLREFLREYVELMDQLLFDFGHYRLEYGNLTDECRDNFTRAVIWNTSTDSQKQKDSLPLLRQAIAQCLVEYEKENGEHHVR